VNKTTGKIKIYTYYDDLKWASQKDLIEVWYTNWESMGFEPCVLTPEDAMNHSLYEHFDNNLKEIYFNIMDREIGGYGMSCWHRWLAYSTITPSNESFYVSDYDVFNTGWLPQKPEKKLHLLCGKCPCLASGTSLQFENLCREFLSLSKKNIDRIKKVHEKRVFHDQNFFVHCGDQLKDVLYTRSKEWGTDAPKLHHISHHAANTRLKQDGIQYNNVTINKVRLDMARELLNHQK
jgi:hypothetical protein